MVEAPKRKRSEPVRIAHGVEGVRREQEQRIGTLNLSEDVGQLLLERCSRGPRQEVQNHLGVGV